VTHFLAHPDLASDRAVAALESCGLEGEEPRPVTRTVLDTFDGRLHAAGLRLELEEGAARELVLSGPPGSPPARLAWEGDAPQRAGDLPAGPFGARVVAAMVERALLPVVDVAAVGRRFVHRDRRGNATVVVVLNGGVTTAAGGPLPDAVAEVHAAPGHERRRDEVVAALAALGTEPGDGDLVDAVVAATGGSLEGHRSSPTVPLERSDDALDAFRAVLANLLTSIEDNLPGTLADLDPEYLHELRVAVRRTRSVLAEGKGVLPGAVRREYRAGFAELGAATGRTRDLDVYVLGWSDIVASLGLEDASVTEPVVAELERRRVAAHAEMAEVLRGEAAGRLLARWRAWLEDPGDELRAADAGPIGPHVASRVARAQAGLLRDGRAITPSSPAERLHDLRKDAKKLRYLFECFGSLFPAKGRKTFVSQLKALQDNLGEHQDAEVQVAELRLLAQDLHRRRGVGAETLLAVGRLVDHLERVRIREREDFAERFAAYDTAPNHELLERLLEKVGTP
jgi:CHAD domain-containing protein